MNVNHTGSASAISNASKEPFQPKLPNLDLNAFSNELNQAQQQDANWFTRIGDNTEKRQLYEDQLRKLRKLQEEAESVSTGFFLNQMNQKLNAKAINDELVTQRTVNDNKVLQQTDSKDTTNQEIIHNRANHQIDNHQKTHPQLHAAVTNKDDAGNSQVDRFSDLLAGANKDQDPTKKTVEKGNTHFTADVSESKLNEKLTTAKPVDPTIAQSQLKPNGIDLKNLEAVSRPVNASTKAQTITELTAKNLKQQIDLATSNRGNTSQTMKGQPVNQNSEVLVDIDTSPTSDIKAAKASVKAESPLNVEDLENNVRYMVSNRKNEMTIRLVPAHLGKVVIRLKKSGDKITGRFKVESKEAKDALESKLGVLQKGLENQGVKVDKFIILVNDHNNPNQSFTSNNGGTNSHFSGQHPNHSNRSEQDSVQMNTVSSSMTEKSSDSELNVYI